MSYYGLGSPLDPIPVRAASAKVTAEPCCMAKRLNRNAAAPLPTPVDQPANGSVEAFASDLRGPAAVNKSNFTHSLLLIFMQNVPPKYAALAAVVRG